MKFSEAWLREWINPEITSEQLCEQLTMAGLEVDDISQVAGDFTGVKVGRVVSCQQHPDADKLRVTQVDIGETELLDIVCGASNCREGLFVAVATVGALLPGNFKIKKAKLRGQPSHGMLCAYQELGIEIEQDGIIELPQDAVIGTDFRDYLKLNDQIIDIDLTPNRADCLGLLGLAREMAALNGLSYLKPSWSPIEPTINEAIDIKLEASKACPKYLGRVIRGVNMSAQTPLWMQEKLRRSGVRSIDPIVDVTNYVMLELGQPMHAFDLNQIEGTVSARYAREGETLVLLDGKEVTLRSDTLVIADQNKALAMAGIFGGLASSVTQATQDIFLECAFFSPDEMRGQARHYGLHTDSSHRFERGVDYALQELAIERASQLISDICGGEFSQVHAVIEADDLPQSKQVTLHKEKLDRVLGHAITHERIEQIFHGLELSFTYTQDTWVVDVPSFRFDLAIEEDLIEEVARVYGYNNIPNVAPSGMLSMRTHKESLLTLNKIRQTLITRGYQEAVTYSFVDPKLQVLMHPNLEALTLPNPISEDMSVMRTSLFTGLLSAVSYNQKRQQNRVRLFETGLRFLPDASSPMGVKQQPVLAAVVSGAQQVEHWNSPTRQADFFDLKSDLECLLELTADALSFDFEKVVCDGFHPGQCAQINYLGEKVGVIGTIHPSLHKTFGLTERTIICEVELACLQKYKVPQFDCVSKFPSNKRDIAIIVDEKVNSNNLLNLIRKVGGSQLVDLNLFDIYQGSSIEQGYKSFAISMVIQDNDRTLEEPEITEMVTKIVSALKSDFNASLRD